VQRERDRGVRGGRWRGGLGGLGWMMRGGKHEGRGTIGARVEWGVGKGGVVEKCAGGCRGW